MDLAVTPDWIFALLLHMPAQTLVRGRRTLPRPGEDLPPSLSLLPFPRRYLYFDQSFCARAGSVTPTDFIRLSAYYFDPLCAAISLTVYLGIFSKLPAWGAAPTPVWLEFAVSVVSSSVCFLGIFPRLVLGNLPILPSILIATQLQCF